MLCASHSVTVCSYGEGGGQLLLVLGGAARRGDALCVVEVLSPDHRLRFRFETGGEAPAIWVPPVTLVVGSDLYILGGQCTRLPFYKLELTSLIWSNYSQVGGKY